MDVDLVSLSKLIQSILDYHDKLVSGKNKVEDFKEVKDIAVEIFKKIHNSQS